METQKSKITYITPTVHIIGDNGLGVSEYAGRTAYDSFDKSENEVIQNQEPSLEKLRDIEESDLLDRLAWVFHHESVLEHTHITFLVKGMARGILQEHARHRLQNITVRSTRYTMSSILNAWQATKMTDDHYDGFRELILRMNIFAIDDAELVDIEIEEMYKKLKIIFDRLEPQTYQSKGQMEFMKDVSKLDMTPREIFEGLEILPQKRNVGDYFKSIVTDNWKTDLVFTMNLRSLKNFIKLRDSGAAWYPMQEFASAIVDALPSKYKYLIIKRRNKKEGRGES